MLKGYNLNCRDVAFPKLQASIYVWSKLGYRTSSHPNLNQYTKFRILTTKKTPFHKLSLPAAPFGLYG